MRTSVVVANHGRDLSVLKASLPKEVEFIEVNLGMERSAQRNIGIKAAKGEIVIWLDSDQSLSAGLVREIEKLMGWGFVALYIPEVIVAKSFFGKVRAFERTFYDGTAVDVPRAVLKSRCPLFDETLNGPEDADWGNKIKGLRAITKGVLYHHDDIGIVEYFKKKDYYAKSMRRYKELNPHDKVLDWKYRCIGIFIENGKWRKIVRHPILFFCVMLVVAVRAYIYIKNK
jgi:glycosyltransferase involved in cell wall biosynthesis